ncbi:protein rep [Pantoea ananatis]|uniref:protein rep n=1 Tax=Pantoea ananas TaxID=553 RepID=UPI00287F0F7E|nr:protein rep [Pantoea ananatis]MDS7719636.1 protein rep [Pantoea ananatis]
MANVAEQLQSAVAKTLKYSVKPENMASDPELFLQLTPQLYKRRLISTGWALKKRPQVESRNQ